MRDMQKNDLKDPVDLIDRMKPMEAKRNKADVWAELEKIMDEPRATKVRSMNFSTWSVAASIAIVVTLSLLATARFYTITINCKAGSQKTTTLPDGSSVVLNSASSLSYHPFWWSFDKKAELNGEAFFEGEHAKNFTITSDKAETTVLGTSFNIFARDNDYSVTCLTGKVKVLAHTTKEEVIITPNQMVSLNNSGKLTPNLNVDAQLAREWTNNQFIFTQIPLKNVLSEVSRRYGISIEGIENLNQPYTGSFVKQEHIEDVLAIICKPFSLDYKKLPSGGFVIEQAP
ncbi:MAG: FecR domain-containing protein [Bacteroidetes bacterium]|nr:FecR domain-containing protein [Bacteroidota bacterium]MBU1373052.1 FecR domain-containing protein [Bacteroidota bacterium]MBU1759354.1 FecR domain-containing protein [Bacteroidota bacterium]MBU2046302.1 FecR domain-containing protein [Bacteroidota bacterium]MBU2268243.1 FecR domain-containing protein [Bacteroidota bacterium]